MDNFIQLSDYDASIHREILDSLLRADSSTYDPETIEICEERTISEMISYLDKRYDCKAIFSAPPHLPIEFQRDGVPDELINTQLESPWFKELRKDIILSHFWGFSLMQFYLDEEGDIRYDLIPRKHYDPIKRMIILEQGDEEGIPIDSFENILFVGKERDLGIFAELMPAVLYKRGNMADWANYCNTFGIPIREYTYDAGDEEARRKLIEDARQQGSSAVYIHPKESSLNLIESNSKSGTSDLFKTFSDYLDDKISILVLGNTLTTQASERGTQALGEVHKEEEDEMNIDDCGFILDVLNYYMTPIFSNLGFNVEGGKFVYIKRDKSTPSQRMDIIQKLYAIGLPIDHHMLYSEFNIEKPDDYEAQMQEKALEREFIRKQMSNPNLDPKQVDKEKDKQEEEEDDTKPSKQRTNGKKTALKQRLARFFALAPHQSGAKDSDW